MKEFERGPSGLGAWVDATPEDAKSMLADMQRIMSEGRAKGVVLPRPCIRQHATLSELERCAGHLFPHLRKYGDVPGSQDLMLYSEAEVSAEQRDGYACISCSGPLARDSRPVLAGLLILDGTPWDIWRCRPCATVEVADHA